MPKVRQRILSHNSAEQVIRQLQSVGEEFWYRHWRESMALPDSLPIDDRESVARYLLLRALLNRLP